MYWSQCIARNKTMTMLDVSNNSFDQDGIRLIERGQYSRRTRLSELQLVAKGMKDNEDTLEVILWRRRMDNGGFDCLKWEWYGCQRFEGRTSIERTEKSVFVIQFYCMMHEVQIFNTFLLSLTSSADTQLERENKEKCDSSGLKRWRRQIPDKKPKNSNFLLLKNFNVPSFFLIAQMRGGK